MYTRVAGAAIFLAVALTSCAPARHRAARSPGLAGGVASVSVRNDSDDDLRIYAIDDAGRRTPIGTVMRASLGRLVLRGEVLHSWHVQFVAVPISGGAPRPFSCPAKIQPGTAVQVRLDQNPISWSCGRE